MLHWKNELLLKSRQQDFTAGLWHADEESIVNMLLDKACESLNQALATGDRYQTRLLLRLLAALTTSNVVSMPSMLGTLTHIVLTAVQVLQDSLGAGATPVHSIRLLCTYMTDIHYTFRSSDSSRLIGTILRFS